jgi:hypothetical protein
MRKHAERSGIVGFTGFFEPSNVANLRLHRRLGDAVVTEDGEGSYVAQFAGAAKTPKKGAGESADALEPKKAGKAAKKGTRRGQKENPRDGR